MRHRKTNMRGIIIILIAAIIVIAIIVLIGVRLKDSTYERVKENKASEVHAQTEHTLEPKEVLTQFYEKVLSGDFEQTYSMLDNISRTAI